MRIVASKAEKKLKVPFTHKIELAMCLKHLVFIFDLSINKFMWTISNSKFIDKRGYVCHERLFL